MCRRSWVLVLMVVAGLAVAARGQVEQDAAALGDRYLATMQAKGYSFLPNEELQRRRDQVVAFVIKHLRRPLDDATRKAMLAGIDRCLERLYTCPAGKVEYGNAWGGGSGGEEWMYLNDRDFFLTLQYHLWVGLVGPALTRAEVQLRDGQRQWMRDFLVKYTYSGRAQIPPRDGMRPEDVRAWVLAELETSFVDPMDLLSEPLPIDRFAMMESLKKTSHGYWPDFQEMKVCALSARFAQQRDAAGHLVYTYPGKFPLDDAVISCRGGISNSGGAERGGPYLTFASNVEFRGDYGFLSPTGVYDVIRVMDNHGVHGDRGVAWRGGGDLALDGATLVAVRGAKMAKLEVMNWFDADKLSDDELRAAIRGGGGARISLTGLPTPESLHGRDRSNGEFFIVVQTREGRLAVINLYRRVANEVQFWCRPRAVKGKAAVGPASRQ